MDELTEKTIEIPSDLIAEILVQCERGKPKEACGILGGVKNRIMKVFPAENMESSPTSYSIKPEFFLQISHQLRSEGMDIIGVYHSHPDGLKGMSLRDLMLGWEDFFYFIVSFEEESAIFQCFQIEEGGPNLVEICIT